jgi:hypothetical protein
MRVSVAGLVVFREDAVSMQPVAMLFEPHPGQRSRNRLNDMRVQQ